jgi:hypothetical protein
MAKQSRSLLLLLVMLWQTFILFVPYNMKERASFWNHQVHHSEALLHHHHQDQSLHLEEANGQIDHVHIDNSSSSAGLIPSVLSTVGIYSSFERWALVLAAIPHPYLEGPLRPPQHSV